MKTPAGFAIQRVRRPPSHDRETIVSDIILQLSHLAKTFNTLRRLEVRAVDDVSLEIPEAESFGLLGESGSGKSTLARLIPRLIEPTSGDILFRGRSLVGRSERELRSVREQIQIVFQNPFSSLNPRMTVRQLIGEPLIVHHRLSGAALDSRVREMMNLVGLSPEHTNRFPHEFSGGQRQRIGIARALVLEPNLLILDEPTSALDVSVQAQILNLLIDLQRKMGLTYLLITHDLSIVRYMCDRVALMYLGKIVEQGSADQVLSHPRHPYTRALLSDVPSTDPDQHMLDQVVLEADTTSAPWSGRGCRFSPRCPAAQIAACATVEPPLSDVGGRQLVACHLAGAVYQRQAG
jgi:oligopeptide/dipeptide ABC transporter ATP-binding protein